MSELASLGFKLWTNELCFVTSQLWYHLQYIKYTLTNGSIHNVLTLEISPRCSSERLGGVASLGTSACSRPNIKTMQATAREETQG